MGTIRDDDVFLSIAGADDATMQRALSAFRAGIEGAGLTVRQTLADQWLFNPGGETRTGAAIQAQVAIDAGIAAVRAVHDGSLVYYAAEHAPAGTRRALELAS